MKNIAFIFPGQGSQKVGMGEDILGGFPEASRIFSLAEGITGLSIKDICFKGPIEDLTRTVNLQPSVTAVNLCCLSFLISKGIHPKFVAGHSLGEFSALCAAGVLSMEDTIRIVFKRGQLMHREASENMGAMAAIVGLGLETIENMVNEEEGIVSVANHNTEKQIVITGAPEAVEKVSEKAAQKGAKAVPLKVSGAWHSKLIEGAQKEFSDFLGTFPFQVPERNVIFNVSAETEQEPDKIKEMMARQLCSPVRWFQSMKLLMENRIDAVVEVGPGRVLTGLMKQILPKDCTCKIYSANSMKSLEQVVDELGN